jgi:hypothetical protein
MKLTHEGLSLWYGTPDAPATGFDGLVPRTGASLVVGVHPAHPANSVEVRFRVDEGIVQSVPGRELRTDFGRAVQYFAVAFPPLPSGNVIEYSPVLKCGGRQAPPPHVASRFPSKFPLAPKDALATSEPLRVSTSDKRRFAAGLDFVASVSLKFEVQFIGDTPAGMRVNFLVREGSVEGEGLRATVTEGSSDQMIVRRDGMGVVRIRAAFATSDGAMLDVESGGYVDFGAEGYQKALAQHLPDRSPLVVSPLISTRHPKYKWLGRVQCIGVGQTHLDAAEASYHVYAVSARARTTSR